MRILRLLAAFLVGALLVVFHPSAPRSVCAGWGVQEADAAVSVAYSLDELVGLSTHAVIAKAVERKSMWEHDGGGRRIVTYTKLEVQETIFGKPQATVWVRTLGGAVGRIGQQVAGEAEFTMGKIALVFLTPTDDKALVVSGAAQGHFPIVKPTRTKPRTLKLSPSLGTVLPRRGPSISIQEALGKKSLDDAVLAIRDSKARIDALKRKK